MKKTKIILPIVGVLVLVVGALVFGFITAHASPNNVMNVLMNNTSMTPTQGTTSSQSEPMHISTIKSPMRPVLAPQPHVDITASAPPRVVPTAPSSLPTQAPVLPIPPATGSDRYYSASTPAATMKAEATNLTKQQVKLLIETQVSKNLGVIENRLGITTLAKADAFFLGQASRESTLNAGLETGSGSSHSYGALQASETAYSSTLYAPETDIPEMTLYAFTPENYYDPEIAIHMGIRHLLHFADQARAANFSGPQLLRHALVGYNTGWVTTSDQNLLQQYSDEIGSLAGWYLNNGHIYDDQFTWTGSSVVDRNAPWGWYS